MFEFVRNNSGQNFPVIEQRPAKASQKYVPGMLLNFASGVMTPATTGPQYVCAEKYDAPATDPGEVSAYPIAPGQQWRTKFAADGKALKAGEKVTIHTDFLQVTATTSSGVFTILEKLGDGSTGTDVIGEF